MALLVLVASWEIAYWIHIHQLPILVHCLQDCTSQVVALAQLMLDPSYCTIAGFATLVKKDIISSVIPFIVHMAKDKVGWVSVEATIATWVMYWAAAEAVVTMVWMAQVVVFWPIIVPWWAVVQHWMKDKFLPFSFKSLTACTRWFSCTLTVLNLTQNTCCWSVNTCISVALVIFCVTWNANTNENWLLAFDNALICCGDIWKCSQTYINHHIAVVTIAWTAAYDSCHFPCCYVMWICGPNIIIDTVQNWQCCGCHWQSWQLIEPKPFCPTNQPLSLYTWQEVYQKGWLPSLLGISGGGW